MLFTCECQRYQVYSDLPELFTHELLGNIEDLRVLTLIMSNFGQLHKVLKEIYSGVSNQCCTHEKLGPRVAGEISGSNFPHTSVNVLALAIALKIFLRLEWESKWFSLTWNYVSLVAMSHFSQSSSARDAPTAIAETRAGHSRVPLPCELDPVEHQAGLSPSVHCLRLTWP